MSTSKAKRLKLLPLVLAKFREARSRPKGYDDLDLAHELVKEHPEEVAAYSSVLVLNSLRDWFGELARSASYDDRTLFLPGFGPIPAVIAFEVKEKPAARLVTAEDGEEAAESEEAKPKITKRRIGLEHADLTQLRSYRNLIRRQRIGLEESEHTITRMIDVCMVRGCRDDQKAMDFLRPASAAAA